jgi:hypothetical protein
MMGKLLKGDSLACWAPYRQRRLFALAIPWAALQ